VQAILSLVGGPRYLHIVAYHTTYCGLPHTIYILWLTTRQIVWPAPAMIACSEITAVKKSATTRALRKPTEVYLTMR
jgi:hypothetical protein